MGLKEASNEPSSPLRHCADLAKVLNSQADCAAKPIVLLYSDGGPDHRITYLTTKIALISLFLRCDLDFLAAVRTAPYQSWRNPVERIMAILNLAFQGVGLMRKEMPKEFEAAISSCKSVKDIRTACSNHPGLKEAIVMSIEPVKILLESLFVRLELKEKPFQIFHSSSSSELDEFWDVILQVESTLTKCDTRATVLKQKHGLRLFLEHCCVQRHYMFCIKKCGKAECKICTPVRLPASVFEQIHFIPDPVPDSGKEHYRSFSDLYGTPTIEKYPRLYKKSQSVVHMDYPSTLQASML